MGIQGVSINLSICGLHLSHANYNLRDSRWETVSLNRLPRRPGVILCDQTCRNLPDAMEAELNEKSIKGTCKIQFLRKTK